MNDINFDNPKPYLDLTKPQPTKTTLTKQQLPQTKPVNDIVNLSKNMMLNVEMQSTKGSNTLGDYTPGQVLQISPAYAKLLGVTSSQPLMTKIVGLSQDQATLETNFGLMQVNTPIKESSESFTKNIPVFETTSNIKFKNVLLKNIIEGQVIKTTDKGILVKTPLGNMELDIKADINTKVKINILEKTTNGEYKIQVQIEKSNSQNPQNTQDITKAIGTADGTTKTLNTFTSPTQNDNPTNSEKGIFIINDKQRFSILIKRMPTESHRHTEIENKQQSSVNVMGKVISASSKNVTVELSSGQQTTSQQTTGQQGIGQKIILNNNNLQLQTNEKVILNIHSLDTNLTQGKSDIKDSPELQKLFTSLINSSHAKKPYINMSNEEKTYNTINLINSIIPRGTPLGAGSLFVAQAMFSMISINNPTLIANIIKIFMGMNPEFKDLKLKKLIQESTKLVSDKQQNKWKSYDLPFMMGDNNFKELKVYHRLYNDDDLNNESVGKRFLIEMNLSSMGGKLQLDGITKQDQRIFDLIIRTNQIIPKDMGANINKIFINTLNKNGYKGTLNFNYNKLFMDYMEI